MCRECMANLADAEHDRARQERRLARKLEFRKNLSVIQEKINAGAGNAG